MSLHDFAGYCIQRISSVQSCYSTPITQYDAPQHLTDSTVDTLAYRNLTDRSTVLLAGYTVLLPYSHSLILLEAAATMHLPIVQFGHDEDGLVCGAFEAYN